MPTGKIVKVLRIGMYVFLVMLFFHHTTLAKDDLEIIRKRVILELTQPLPDDDLVEALMNSIRADGSWANINYEDVSRIAFDHRNHLRNMVLISIAWKNPKSRYHKSKKAKKALISALEFWVDHDFICDNWWHNQIGTPNSLVTVMLIMDRELPGELVEKVQPIIGRAHLNASGARPSGDRIKIAGILAKNLLYIRDEEQFGEVIKVIDGEIKFVTGRGMQYDYSFHHRKDGVNNTLSYGTGYANAFVEWAVYTEGTKYSFSDKKLQQLIDYYLDGICKMMVFGKYPDPGTKNRSFSRRGTLKAWNAQTPEKLLLTTGYRKKELQEIVDIRNGVAKPTLSHATFYWHTEHFAFQRPDFFTSVRMYSTRNHNMEKPYNSEGLLNHHRGDGTNHNSGIGTEYYDIAPVFDYQKVPGATIMQKPSLPPPEEIQKRGLTDFVGAVTDGLYGAVAFDFKSPHDPLAARKAWFFFDQGYACLGAGINCRTKLPVFTTLNQCLLRDKVIVKRDGQQTELNEGTHELTGVSWVFHDGVGYIFPEPQKVFLSNQPASGSWYRINHQMSSPREEISMDVFTLWLDHGRRPEDGSYSYMVMPATDVQKLDRSSRNGNLEILANTPEIQAVRHKGLNIAQVVFYKSGEIRISDSLILGSDSAGAVMLKTNNGALTKISVSDPNRELGEMHIYVTSRIEKSGDNFKTVWNGKKGISEISIDLPVGVYTGKSVTINL